MVLIGPRFGGEVFQIKPNRRLLARRHSVDIGCREIAGKTFNHNVCRSVASLSRATFPLPMANIDTVQPLLVALLQRWAQGPKRRQLINPEPHAQVVFRSKLACEAPTDANVTKVIDHCAEDIPARHSLINCYLHSFWHPLADSVKLDLIVFKYLHNQRAMFIDGCAVHP